MAHPFQERLADARAEVARLERMEAAGTCREVGCDMQFAGGRWCGCEDGACSVPVLVCTRCGDSDYGDSPAADRVRAECEARS